MECAIGWLIDGNKSEKRDFDSYMIPEDDVAGSSKVGEVDTGPPHDAPL